ncbi:MAG: SusC/RagA family TonB-linked outer membrane protein [Chitinophagaceae bacterium]
MKKRLLQLPSLLRRFLDFSGSTRGVYMIVLLLNLATALSASAQDPIKIDGIVTDENSTPVSGVNVTDKTSKLAAVTDSKGYYTINVPLNGTLIFSYVGFETQEITVTKTGPLNVTMKTSTKALEDVVVIGYGTRTRKEVTSAVAHVKESDFVKGPVTTPMQLLAGKVSGLSVNRPSGDPNASPEITLRGINSIKGANSPLIIIDGVPNASLATIQPEDVKSVDVLKDASAAAIYGSQASGGVIIVTTKSGQGAKGTTVSYNGWAGIDKLANRPRFLNATEYLDFYEQNKADGFVDIPKAADMRDYGGDANWIDAVTQTAFTHSHNVAVTGGWNKSSFSGSATYRENEGIIQTTRNKTFTTRLNFITSALNDRLTLNYTIQNSSYDNALPTPIWPSVLNRNPTIPVYTDNGDYYEPPPLSTPIPNPLAALYQRKAQQKGSTLLVNTSTSFKIIGGLKTTLQYGWQKWNQNASSYQFVNSQASINAGLDGTAQIQNWSSTQRTLNYTLEYDKRFGSGHAVNAVAGYSYQDLNGENSIIQNSGFFNDIFLWNNIGAGSAGVPANGGMIGSSASETKLAAFFGRINYSYNSKYMLSASLRREGSSVFGSENRWGLFPAVSAGWMITNEDFMAESKLFDELKFRVGYGVTGTQPAYNGVTINTLAPAGAALGNRFYNNGNWNTIAYAPTQNYNPFLKWESNAELNIGVDFVLKKNKLSGSIDYYNKRINNLIYDYYVATPPNIYPISTLNVGSMKNSGIELLLRANLADTKDFQLNTTLTFSHNSNKVVSLSNEYNKLEFADIGYIGDVFATNTHRLEEGLAMGNFYGYKFLGFDEQGKWILDNNGQPGNSASATKQIIGNGIPKMNAGLTVSASYKSFDLSFLLRGAFKYQILNLYRMYYENVTQLPFNILKSALDVPLRERPVYSDYYLENGDYVKLDNVSIGYTLPIRSSAFKRMRVSVSALNLAVFTGYKGMDPEVFTSGGLTPGIDGTAGNTQTNPYVFFIYPRTRAISVGLNVEF